jgi:hypothetical protein
MEEDSIKAVCPVEIFVWESEFIRACLHGNKWGDKPRWVDIDPSD